MENIFYSILKYFIPILRPRTLRHKHRYRFLEALTPIAQLTELNSVSAQNKNL